MRGALLAHGLTPQPLTKEALTDALEHRPLVIDALFGSGLSRALAGDLEEMVETLNRSGADILSVDLPSGLSADTGRYFGATRPGDADGAARRGQTRQLPLPGQTRVRSDGNGCRRHSGEYFSGAVKRHAAHARNGAPTPADARRRYAKVRGRNGFGDCGFGAVFGRSGDGVPRGATGRGGTRDARS